MSKEILEAVGGLSKQIDEQKALQEKSLTEYKSALETKLLDAKKELDAIKLEHANEVKAINEDSAKQGATLEEIRKEILELKAKGGRMKGQREMEQKAAELIAEAFEANFEDIKKVGGKNSSRMEIKAAGNMTSALNLTGNPLATYDLTPAVRGRRKVNFRDLVPVINSATGIWKFYRENTPVGQGSLSQQTTHGAAKSQIDYALTEVTVTADYLSAFVRFAKQMAQDLPFLQQFIANELVEDYKRSESNAFLPALCSAATGATGIGGDTVLAEQYIDMIASLMANDYNPNAIITTAANWATILKTKPQNYSIPGGVQITPDGTVTMVGVPLIAQNNMALGKTLVGDFTKAAIIQAEGLSVNFFEQDSDNVQKNLITARVEARVGLAILRPDAFVYN